MKTDLERHDKHNLIANKLCRLDRDQQEKIYLSQKLFLQMSQGSTQKADSHHQHFPSAGMILADAKMLGEIAVSSFNQVGGT